MSILHFQHKRQIKCLESVEKYGRVCFELDALAACGVGLRLHI